MQLCNIEMLVYTSAIYDCSCLSAFDVVAVLMVLLCLYSVILLRGTNNKVVVVAQIILQGDNSGHLSTTFVEKIILASELLLIVHAAKRIIRSEKFSLKTMIYLQITRHTDIWTYDHTLSARYS